MRPGEMKDFVKHMQQTTKEVSNNLLDARIRLATIATPKDRRTTNDRRRGY